jgi:hypothetical protein
MDLNQKAILMHMKQHFPTSDCWTNVKLSKQKLAKLRRISTAFLHCNAKVQDRCSTQWLESMHNPRFLRVNGLLY